MRRPASTAAASSVFRRSLDPPAKAASKRAPSPQKAAARRRRAGREREGAPEPSPSAWKVQSKAGADSMAAQDSEILARNAEAAPSDRG